MAVSAITLRVVVPNAISPKANVRFRLLRDGEVTAGRKYLRLYRGWSAIGQVALAFCADDGEFTQTCSVDIATIIDQGEWLAAGIDDAAPRKTRAVYISLTEAGTYTFNITSGEGGGGNLGEPASVQARVRVDGATATREIVVVERPSDGNWRMAGYGPATGGDAVIDLRVTDGQCYAIGLDDWGIQYQTNLAVTVGQTVRPTVYTGWLYRVTEAGVLPATEPEWWPAEGDNASRPLGTARAIAVRYYQPLAAGPLPVEVL